MKTIKKLQAISFINMELNLSLNNTNTVFSNITLGSRNVWWFEPHNSKFSKDLNVLLYDFRNETLLYFLIPANDISNPEDVFRQRRNNTCSHIEIEINDNRYLDIRRNEIEFAKYLVNTVKFY